MAASAASGYVAGAHSGQHQAVIRGLTQTRQQGPSETQQENTEYVAKQQLQDPNAGNSRIECRSQQASNAISGTSGHRSSTPMVASA